jgi:hypothetical protein
LLFSQHPLVSAPLERIRHKPMLEGLTARHIIRK